MIEKKENKLAKVKEFLDKKDVFYTEMANGQIQVASVNLWVTTEKFYNPETGFKGQGVSMFVKYLKDTGKI